jgi:hypothetical protein
MEKNKIPSTEMPRPETNARLSLNLVPGYPDNNPLSKVPRPLSGSAGVYRITFFLSVPGRGSFQDELNLEKLANSGESLLQTLPDIIFDAGLASDTGSANISFMSDAQGVLKIAQIKVDAENFEGALRFAHNAIFPVLSYWSYRYDVALDTTGYEAIEEKTGTRQYTFGVIGKNKALDLNEEFKLYPNFRPLYSNYREAVNATNVFYQVLSFYKVTEGIKRMRDDRKKEMVARGEIQKEVSEKIPDNLNDIETETKDAFTPYLGKKFTWVLDQFRSVLRNAVAHLDPTGNILDADKYDDVMSCNRAIPVLKYIARQMLESELKSHK